MTFAALLATADRLALSHLGGPVSYRPEYDEPITVSGIFDAEYRRADASDPGVASVGPAVFLRLADLVRADGTQIDPTTDHPVITVAGVEYRVREPYPDQQGGILLFLQRA